MTLVKALHRGIGVGLLLASTLALTPVIAADTVRVAVVGGLVMSGIWPAPPRKA